MASMFVAFGDQDFELTVSLRVAQRICTRTKMTTEQLVGHLGDALPVEMAEILKMGVCDPTKAEELEDAIMDGGCGAAHLRNVTAEYLLELTYPGTPEEKEAGVAATKGANEEQKNAMRAVLGLPLKPLSDPPASGSN